jgi:hypothetical protein
METARADEPAACEKNQRKRNNGAYRLWIHVIQVTLDESHAAHQIRAVKVVRNVPADGSKPAPLQRGDVQEGDPTQHRLPLRGERVLQLFLECTDVGSLQTGLQPSRSVVGVSYGHLCK